MAWSVRLHVPLSMTTSLPAIVASLYSLSMQPDDIVPLALRSTTMLSVTPSVNAPPLASSSVRFWPLGVRNPFAAGKTRGERASMAATVITTTIPPAAALVAASESALSAAPYGDPSDRLTTSISLATAQSIASTVMSVEPVHPNTRIEYRSAPGATPGPIVNDCSSVVGSYGPWKVAPVDNTPKPAIVPATWLPCPLQSSGFGSGCGTSLAGSVEAEL